jgi:DNA-binding CsgD family transcriptional regulator
MTVHVMPHAGIDAALATATREVLIARAADPGSALRRIDHDNLRRGVRYRILLPEQLRANPVLALRMGRLAPPGAEIRTVPTVPTDATVVDGALAMLPGEGRAAGLAVAHAAGLAMVRMPSVVGTVVALFEQLWASAAPLTRSDLADGAGLSAREHELLALLSAGCTDESAAARLGISVRTVRRMMAAIMTRLGARSRFQAGLKAADRGLLARAG